MGAQFQLSNWGESLGRGFERGMKMGKAINDKRAKDKLEDELEELKNKNKADLTDAEKKKLEDSEASLKKAEKTRKESTSSALSTINAPVDSSGYNPGEYTTEPSSKALKTNANNKAETKTGAINKNAVQQGGAGNPYSVSEGVTLQPKTALPAEVPADIEDLSDEDKAAWATAMGRAQQTPAAPGALTAQVNAPTAEQQQANTTALPTGITSSEIAQKYAGMAPSAIANHFKQPAVGSATAAPTQQPASQQQSATGNGGAANQSAPATPTKGGKRVEKQPYSEGMIQQALAKTKARRTYDENKANAGKLLPEDEARINNNYDTAVQAAKDSYADARQSAFQKYYLRTGDVDKALNMMQGQDFAEMIRNPKEMQNFLLQTYNAQQSDGSFYRIATDGQSLVLHNPDGTVRQAGIPMPSKADQLQMFFMQAGMRMVAKTGNFNQVLKFMELQSNQQLAKAKMEAAAARDAETIRHNRMTERLRALAIQQRALGGGAGGTSKSPIEWKDVDGAGGQKLVMSKNGTEPGRELNVYRKGGFYTEIGRASCRERV